MLNLGFISTCRKKNRSQLPLKYIDVTMDYLYKSGGDCKKNVSKTYWNVDERSNLVRFVDRIREVHACKIRNVFQAGYMWSGGAPDEDSCRVGCSETRMLDRTRKLRLVSTASDPEDEQVLRNH